jgi:hypothetical protein
MIIYKPMLTYLFLSEKSVEIIYSRARRVVVVVLLQTVVLFVVDVFSIQFLLVVLSD